jgi:hypothetical protein
MGAERSGGVPCPVVVEACGCPFRSIPVAYCRSAEKTQPPNSWDCIRQTFTKLFEVTDSLIVARPPSRQLIHRQPLAGEGGGDV